MELMFSGENRHRARAQLIDIYNTVASSIRVDMSDDQPAGQVVLIHGERGQGKSRLALELYRYLARLSINDIGYWPKTFSGLEDGSAVMPAAEACDFEQEFPFLWWGMNISDGPRAGNTVLGSLDGLLPHLVMMRVARSRARSGASIFKEFADIALDDRIGDAALDIAGESLQVGTIKRIAETVLAIGSVIREHAQEERDPIVEAQRQTESVIDELFVDLNMLLNPKSRHFAARPAVILVDDAQFADSDDAMSGFIERLVSHIVEDCWPVLLVLTHWSRNLIDSKDHNGQFVKRSDVARVLEHATSADRDEPGEFAKMPGATLPTANLHRIDLSEPAEGLEAAILSEFPLLGEENSLAIAAHAGGNPRKVEQILLIMKRKSVWFNGHPKTMDRLTTEGLTSVLALSDLRIDEIVRERFEDSPESVRYATSLASIMGYRFLIALLELIYKLIEKGTIREALDESEVIYRFVRNVTKRGADDIGQFNEKLFLEAAQTYRHDGLADRELTGWPGDDILAALLDQQLRGLVAAPDSVAGLSTQDYSLAFGIAFDRWRDHDETGATLALARLVVVDEKRRNLEVISRTGKELSDRIQRGWLTLDSLRCDELSSLGQTFFRIGELDQAVIMYKKSLTFEAELGRKKGIAYGYVNLGNVHQVRGELDKAVEMYESALGLLATELGQMENMAIIYGNLGVVHFTRGDLSRAVDMHKRALELYTDLDSKNKMASVYGNLGNVHWRRGELDQAEVMHNRALALDTALGRVENTATYYGSLGSVHWTRGELDKAVEMYEKALAINTELGQKRGMAANCGNLGLVHGVRGEMIHALTMHEMALQLNTELGDKGGMADNISNLGLEHSKRGELDQAVKMYKRALRLNSELGNKEGIASQYNSLGNVHRQRGEPDEAVKMYERALALYTELGDKNGLAKSYGGLGNMHATRGELDQAAEMYEKALAIDIELGSKVGIAIQCGNLGVLEKNRGDLDQALVMLEKALALNIELGRKEGIASDYGNLGNVRRNRGDLDQAVEMYEKALALNTELGRKEGMAIQYGNLGLVYQTCGEKKRVKECWTHSAKLFAQIGSPDQVKVRGWIKSLNTGSPDG